MATPSRQPDPEPDPVDPANSGNAGDTTSDSPQAPKDSAPTPDMEKSRPQDAATGTAPLIEDRQDTGGNKRQINAARMEVRLRRIALLGLVLVPLVYFIVQSLR